MLVTHHNPHILFLVSVHSLELNYCDDFFFLVSGSIVPPRLRSSLDIPTHDNSVSNPLGLCLTCPTTVLIFKSSVKPSQHTPAMPPTLQASLDCDTVSSRISLSYAVRPCLRTKRNKPLEYIWPSLDWGWDDGVGARNWGGCSHLALCIQTLPAFFSSPLFLISFEGGT